MYKLTLERLCEDGTLILWQLDGPHLPQRSIYMTVEAKRWVEQTLPKTNADRGRLSALDQAVRFLDAFTVGNSDTFDYNAELRPPFKLLRPIKFCVWEARTAALRMFGWFPQPFIFIFVSGALKKDLIATRDQKIRQNISYGKIRDDIVYFRQLAGMDKRLFRGEDYRDVL